VIGLNDDVGSLGFAVGGIFLLAWGASALIYRWKGYGAMAVETVSVIRR
jgi:nickel/cobalt transporter (NiCoT) family protein